jgi:ketosteroid isomerase-like protein
MRTFTTIAALLTVSTLAFAQAMTASSAGAAEPAIRRANAQEVRALLANDVTTLARLWSDDFVVTNPLNQFVTKRQVIGLIRSDTLAFQSYDRKIEYVRVYGDVAVVAGSEVVVWAGKMPTAGKLSRLRFTAVWMRRGGQWEEVARHANTVAAQ